MMVVVTVILAVSILAIIAILFTMSPNFCRQRIPRGAVLGSLSPHLHPNLPRTTQKPGSRVWGLGLGLRV